MKNLLTFLTLLIALTLNAQFKTDNIQTTETPNLLGLDTNTRIVLWDFPNDSGIFKYATVAQLQSLFAGGGGSDNLGNHTATQDLQLGAFDVFADSGFQIRLNGGGASLNLQTNSFNIEETGNGLFVDSSQQVSRLYNQNIHIEAINDLSVPRAQIESDNGLFLEFGLRLFENIDVFANATEIQPYPGSTGFTRYYLPFGNSNLTIPIQFTDGNTTINADDGTGLVDLSNLNLGVGGTTYNGFNETGTKATNDLVATVGDNDATGNGNKVEVNDGTNRVDVEVNGGVVDVETNGGDILLKGAVDNLGNTINSGGVTVTDAIDGSQSSLAGDKIAIGNATNSFKANLKSSSVTSNRDIEFQNKNYTVAGLDDIPGTQLEFVLQETDSIVNLIEADLLAMKSHYNEVYRADGITPVDTMTYIIPEMPNYDSSELVIGFHSINGSVITVIPATENVIDHRTQTRQIYSSVKSDNKNRLSLTTLWQNEWITTHEDWVVDDYSIPAPPAQNFIINSTFDDANNVQNDADYTISNGEVVYTHTTGGQSFTWDLNADLSADTGYNLTLDISNTTGFRVRVWVNQGGFTTVSGNVTYQNGTVIIPFTTPSGANSTQIRIVTSSTSNSANFDNAVLTHQ